MDFDMSLAVRNDKNGTITSFCGNVKNTIKYCACKQDYTWNPNTLSCLCDKDFEIGEYLEDFKCMKMI